MREVRQQLQIIQQSRNQEQLSTARLTQNFISANLPKEKTPPELSALLPYPDVWILFGGDRKLGINKATALDVMRNYEELSTEMKGLIEPYLREIEAVLRS